VSDQVFERAFAEPGVTPTTEPAEAGVIGQHVTADAQRFGVPAVIQSCEWNLAGLLLPAAKRRTSNDRSPDST